MIYGYARVSSRGQARDGNSLEVQEKQLKENGAEIIYKDVFTGKTTNRPEFNRLLSELKEGDMLIVTKLDRFARSILQGIETIESLLDKGVKVNVLTFRGILDNTPESNLQRNILFSFAQFERDMIVNRTQEGKQQAKLKAQEEGKIFREGRPNKFNIDQLENALSLLENKSYSQVSSITGMSISTLTRVKRKYKASNLSRTAYIQRLRNNEKKVHK